MLAQKEGVVASNFAAAFRRSAGSTDSRSEPKTVEQEETNYRQMFAGIPVVDKEFSPGCAEQPPPPLCTYELCE